MSSSKCCDRFEKKDEKCKPYCDNSCENGKCIGNNVCECNQGYKEFSPTSCTLECSKCDNGYCIRPENVLIH
ncbi:unnamed protein product [Diamesa tonsa]